MLSACYNLACNVWPWICKAECYPRDDVGIVLRADECIHSIACKQSGRSQPDVSYYSLTYTHR
jgi:hypothetical protein